MLTLLLENQFTLLVNLIHYLKKNGELAVISGCWNGDRKVADSRFEDNLTLFSHWGIAVCGDLAQQNLQTEPKIRHSALVWLDRRRVPRLRLKEPYPSEM